MNLFEIAWQWTVLLLAEVLNASASVVEAVLRSQPRWVAKVRLIEENLRARASGEVSEPEATTSGGGLVPGGRSIEALLQSYAILSQTLRDIEARGLSLDSALMDRMKREWTSESIVGYLQSSETQLRQSVSEHLDRAAAVLGVEARSLFADSADPSVESASASPAPPGTGGRAGVGRSNDAPAGRRMETVQ